MNPKSLLSFCTAAVFVHVAKAGFPLVGDIGDPWSAPLLKSVGVTKAGGIASRSTNDNVDWSAHQWIAPGAGDLRGPCPGLNTLANHGFLPRDGKNLNMSVILDAAFKGYHTDPEVIAGAVKLATLSTDEFFSFTLDDIKLHGVIEHDASLSRNDEAIGDHVHFNETIFSVLANSNPGVDYYNSTSAAQVLKQRLAESESTNPNITNTLKELQIRVGESYFYLAVMGDPVTGVAPKKFVDIFFREERLPIEEGWKRPSVFNVSTLTPVVIDIVAGTNWTTSGGCPWVRQSPEGPAILVQHG